MKQLCHIGDVAWEGVKAAAMLQQSIVKKCVVSTQTFETDCRMAGLCCTTHQHMLPALEMLRFKICAINMLTSSLVDVKRISVAQLIVLGLIRCQAWQCTVVSTKPGL